MTNEQVITRIKHNLMYRDDRETADYIIKALEQQPNEDCVSRQAVLDTLMKYEKPCDDRQDFYLDSTTEFEEEIKEMPPVTPTYGTCKDCNHLGVMDCGYYCKLYHWGKISKEGNYGGMGDFYCADFEKRDNNKPKTYIDCQKCENYRNPDYSKCMECGK